MTQPMTLHDACHHYIQHLETLGKRPRTLYTYSRDLDQVQAFFGAAEALSAISLPRVGKFLKSDDLLKLPNGKDRAEPTVKKTIRVFRSLIVWCHAQGWIETLPLPKGIVLDKKSQ